MAGEKPGLNKNAGWYGLKTVVSACSIKGRTVVQGSLSLAMKKYLLIGASAFVLGAGSMAYVGQQASATAQPRAWNTASRSGQREGVSGWTISVMVAQASAGAGPPQGG